LNYIDDFIFIAPSGDADAYFKLTIDIIKSLGFQVSSAK
jgi:hypothetical protein